MVRIPQCPEKKKSLYLPYGTVKDGNWGYGSSCPSGNLIVNKCKWGNLIM